MQVLASRVLVEPRDFAGSVEFYEHRLGLVRFRDWGEPPRRGVVYFLGGGYLELSEAPHERSDPHEDSSGRCRRVRLWLQVADAQAAREELATRGVEIASEPEMKPWGLIEMAIHDPDGLELVVVEVPTSHPLRRRQ